MVIPSSEVSRLFRGVVGKGLAVGDISAGAEWSEESRSNWMPQGAYRLVRSRHIFRETGGVGGS